MENKLPSLIDIGGIGKEVDLNELDRDDYLNMVYRIQFYKPPQPWQLDKVVNAIKKRPEIGLRFYGDYSENLIDWSKLAEVQSLFINLWKTNDLTELSKLTNLRKLGISKCMKSNASLKLLLPLENLEALYTDISKDVEMIGNIRKLKFLSLSEIKHGDLDFLTTLDDLRTIWLSLGSFQSFSGLSKIKKLERLQVHQVRGFESDKVNEVLGNCKEVWALKLDNLKHIIDLDFVPSMRNLKYLSLEGVKNLDSYEKLKSSSTLEAIVGYDCRPEDRSLDGLKNLKKIKLGDSYSKAEVDKLLSDNSADYIWIRGKNLIGTGDLENPFSPGNTR